MVVAYFNTHHTDKPLASLEIWLDKGTRNDKFEQ